ncbi:MAG: TonB-dependent receptor [Vicinamibacterales bacterium]
MPIPTTCSSAAARRSGRITRSQTSTRTRTTTWRSTRTAPRPRSRSSSSRCAGEYPRPVRATPAARRVSTAGYAQDEWRPRKNVTVTAGVRFDVSTFKNTASQFDNAAADALTFRSTEGTPIRFSTGSMPDTKPLWSPRIGINWDVFGDASTQVRGGTGLFSGRPATSGSRTRSATRACLSARRS